MAIGENKHSMCRHRPKVYRPAATLQIHAWDTRATRGVRARDTQGTREGHAGYARGTRRVRARDTQGTREGHAGYARGTRRVRARDTH